MSRKYCTYEFYAPGIIKVVREDDVNETHVRLVREHAHRLTESGLSYRQLHDHYVDLLRDAPAIFVDEDNKEVELDIETLESLTIDWWFRDIAKAITPETPIGIRRESKPRYALLYNIVAAHSRAQG